jgi:HK97 family phage major capsid protein
MSNDDDALVGAMKGVLEQRPHLRDRVLGSAKPTPKGGLPVYGDPKDRPEPPDGSLGEALIRSDAYREWIERFPNGAPAQRMDVWSEQVPVSLRFGQHGDRVLRTLVTAQETSAGDLVRPDYRGLLEPGLVRPLRLVQLVSVIPTSSDQVEYTKEVSREAVAAPVIEATATTGTTGTKPEGGVVFDVVIENVRTFAVWLPVTKRVLADATGLRAYVDQYLRDDIALEIEDQMISGSGSGESFRGILNASPAIGDAGAPGAGESALDQARKARRLVEVNGRTTPTGLVLHPTDAQKIDLLKRNSEVNNFVRDPYATVGPVAIFGMPVVVTDALPAGTGLVGDFRRAALFEREDTAISVGTAGDDFIRNIVRILAEGRWGFGVLRSAAFAKFTIP